MPEKHAFIETHVEEVFRGRQVRTLAWKGPRTATVELDADDWDENIKKLAPWPLKVVSVNWMRGIVIVARADGPYIISYWYHNLTARGKNATAIYRARLIMTLMVWGLAYVPDGEIPSLQHIGKKPWWKEQKAL